MHRRGRRGGRHLQLRLGLRATHGAAPGADAALPRRLLRPLRTHPRLPGRSLRGMEPARCLKTEGQGAAGEEQKKAMLSQPPGDSWNCIVRMYGIGPMTTTSFGPVRRPLGCRAHAKEDKCAQSQGFCIVSVLMKGAPFHMQI